LEPKNIEERHLKSIIIKLTPFPNFVIKIKCCRKFTADFSVYSKLKIQIL